MDTLEAIATRRSVRRFTGEPVDEAAIDAVLRAGFCAPSATNRRPFHFVVVRDSETLHALHRIQPMAQMLPAAGCAVVACGDRLLQPLKGFLVEDVSAAIQNMLLAAHAQGLGAVWCGLHPIALFTGGVRRALKLPRHILPVGMIALGHPEKVPGPRDRFDAARVHQERW